MREEKEVKKKLREEVLKAIVKMNSTETNKVFDYVSKKGLPHGNMSKIINGTLNQKGEAYDIMALTHAERICFVTGIYNLDPKKFKGLKPEEYFQDSEIEDEKVYRPSPIEELKEIVIDDCYETYDGNYKIYRCPVVSYRQIAQWAGSSLLNYNPDTQRELVDVKTGITTIKRININDAHVEEIYEAMKSGDFCDNMITLNIRSNGYEKYDYNATKKQLTIQLGERGKQFLDIIDGFHRYTALINLMGDFPMLTRHMILRIVNENVNGAWRIIEQENKVQKINEEHIKQHSPRNISMTVAKKLNGLDSLSENFIYGKIGTQYELDNESKYTTFDIMWKAINDSFDLKDDAHTINKVSQYLARFLTKISFILIDKFGEELDTLQHSYVYLHPHIFAGYVVLAGYLFKKDNWEEILENVTNEIDFSKENPDWSKIDLFAKKFENRHLKKISNYFFGLLGKYEKEEQNTIEIEEVAISEGVEEDVSGE